MSRIDAAIWEAWPYVEGDADLVARASERCPEHLAERPPARAPEKAAPRSREQEGRAGVKLAEEKECDAGRLPAGCGALNVGFISPSQLKRAKPPRALDHLLAQRDERCRDHRRDVTAVLLLCDAHFGPLRLQDCWDRARDEGAFQQG